MVEFNLSEKIHKGSMDIDLPPYIDKIDVREAIQRLKEYFNDINFPSCAVEMSEEINRIFGEELTNG